MEYAYVVSERKRAVILVISNAMLFSSGSLIFKKNYGEYG